VQDELIQGVAILSESTKVTIQNLLTVKSIVTILLTGVFSFLAIVGRISGEQFLTTFSRDCLLLWYPVSEKCGGEE